MKWCKIAPGKCKRPGGPCCKNCVDKTCRVRCLNDPRWCGCFWEDKPLPRNKPRLDREEIARLYEAGLLQREIASRLGCSTSGVSAVLKEIGGACRDKS